MLIFEVFRWDLGSGVSAIDREWLSVSNIDGFSVQTDQSGSIFDDFDDFDDFSIVLQASSFRAAACFQRDGIYGAADLACSTAEGVSGFLIWEPCQRKCTSERRSGRRNELDRPQQNKRQTILRLHRRVNRYHKHTDCVFA